MKIPGSIIFTITAKWMFFFLNAFSIYLLLRGHNMPGGGFIAGIVSAISVIILTLALGLEEIHRIIRIDMAWISFAGLSISAATGIASLILGKPFLEHHHAYINLPVMGTLGIGSTLAFDLGVMLTVVGVTCKILFVVAKSTEGFRTFVDREESRYSAIVEEPIETVQPEEDRNSGSTGLVEK